MSIPRLAIHRPVTMFMLSLTVLLLGAISLTRLPVDLLPDVSYPSLTVRVGYAGVGPVEIEELIVRPLEQSLAAVPGLEQVNSTAQEGSGTVRLNFVWGTDLNEAADEVRTRVDRIRGRLPVDADPPTIFKFDSNTFPIMGIGVEGDYDRVTLREMAETDLVPRLERVEGVASVTVDGGLRRQIRVELSREKITALDLPVDRIIQTIRTENQNVPLGEVNEGDTTFLLRASSQFESIDDIRNLIVFTRNGVPVYLRDVAEVRDTTEDFRSFTRINGKPGVRMRVTKQSGKNTVAIADDVRAEIVRINRDVQGLQLTVLDDQAIFIEQSISGVRDAALFGAILVIIVIFAFLRNLRSTFIICTSIPISIIGTFALLHFSGFTLNTMTFGGLALGVGMIVDASIVVLENTFRHMEMGKPRMQAAIEGSEEVWSAILASTLTHVAVFVPLLFLSGVSSIIFTQLAIVVMFSLSMSLFVAVTIVPVLCSRLLVLPKPVHERAGLSGWLFTMSERTLDSLDTTYRKLLHTALQHRPTVLLTTTAMTVAAIMMLQTIPAELMPQTDEGEVSVNARLAVGSRIERSEATVLQLEDLVNQHVPEMITLVSSAGGGGWMGGGAGSVSLTLKLTPKDQRRRSSEQIATDLRAVLVGLPGVSVTTRASGGNQSLSRILGNDSNSRLSVEVRGFSFDDSNRLQQDVLALLQTTEGVANPQIGRQEGRPELSIRVDRPKAALLGLSVSNVSTAIRTSMAGTQAAVFRERGKEFPIIVRLREEDRERSESVGDVLISTPSGLVLPAKNVLTVDTQRGPTQIDRKNQERIARVNAELQAGVPLGDAVTAVQARLGALDIPQDFTVGFGAEVETQGQAFNQLQVLLLMAVLLVYAVMASQYESLKDPFIVMFAVPVAIIGVV
ncbi:MAG: efflux RND transporter permease subunit, partial [Acidobacteria bacterium]|nr:efflux RND transporter permease subunit [Acidobacteriota bacterium]